MSGLPSEYWNMTPRETIFSIEGYYKRVEREERNSWERARWSAFRILLPHLDKKKSVKITDLGVFPWEEVKAEKKTKKDIEELLKRVSKKYNIDTQITLTDGEVVRGTPG